jgi:SAM-dependent methyltransferase
MSTKTIQGRLWSTAPQYWAQHFEPGFMPMYKNVLNQLQLSDELSLLDAGCGSGLFSSLAIESGAEVTGIDAAPGLLELARRRNPQNNFMEEDLEDLPFPENSFDVVTGFNSFQYAGDFEKALLEAKRVLRPGGQLVIGIWAKPEMSDATVILKAIGSLLPPPPAGTPGPFALSEDGKMESILDKAGLELIYKDIVPCPYLYYNLSDGVRSFMGTGPAAAAMMVNEKKQVEQTIARAFHQFRVVDDMHFLQNHFLVFIAKK